MRDMHLAVCIGFGLVGVLIAYVGHRLYNSEKELHRKHQQIKQRIDKENQLRSEAVKRLVNRIDGYLENSPDASNGLSALIAVQKELEAIYYQWLSEEHVYFNVSVDDKVHVVGISNGRFKYTLPDNLRSIKRK